MQLAVQRQHESWTELTNRILVVGFLCLLGSTAGCRSQTNQAPKPEEIPAARQSNSVQIYAQNVDGRSKIYVQPPGAEAVHRLTDRVSEWEEFPALSRSGTLVAYSLSDGPEAKSEVWLSRIDGSHALRVSAPDEDAFMPAFGADDRTLLYAISRFSGHYSPIARPRRHEFDIVKVTVDPDGPIAGAIPSELTQQHFFDLRSLSVSPDGEHFLLSTSGYPIGSLIEEFDISKPLQIKKIFQPHVPGEPSMGAQFGQAAYVGDGMLIVFTAATEGKDGNYDYSIYQMNDVTGGDLVTLARHSGMIDDLTVGNDGSIFITAGGKRYSLDTQAHSLR